MDLSAKISAPYPTIPATINEPLDGAQLTNPNIDVRGTCEHLTPSSVVALYIDNVNAGSVPCASDGTYYLAVTLTGGTHSLLARTLNSTDDFGPDGTPVSVTYTPPAPPPAAGGGTPGTSSGRSGSSASRSTSGGATGQAGGGSCANPSPLTIESKDVNLDYGRYLPAKWQFSIHGGCAPYTLALDWGDGVTEHFLVDDSQTHEFSHAYAKMQPHYTVTARVWDKDKLRTTYTMAAVTPNIPGAMVGSLKPVDLPFILTFEGTLIRAYFLWLLLLLLVALAWYDKHIKRVRIAGVPIFPKHPS
jgi:hypothetical protein